MNGRKTVTMMERIQKMRVSDDALDLVFRKARTYRVKESVRALQSGRIILPSVGRKSRSKWEKPPTTARVGAESVYE